jgi:hypothetical protein
MLNAMQRPFFGDFSDRAMFLFYCMIIGGLSALAVADVVFLSTHWSRGIEAYSAIRGRHGRQVP